MTKERANKEKINIAIIGATGYTGAELVRLAILHPNINIKYLIGNNSVGKDYTDIYPHITQYKLPKIQDITAIDTKNLDVIFTCLPHGASHKIIRDLPESVKIIDLSADFRLNNLTSYEEIYGKHEAPDLLKKAVYGLTEINRAAIKEANLVACPGCYPTSALLPLIPLLRSKVIDSRDIIIDSKSGVTGAGRKPDSNLLFSEVDSACHAYAIGSHRHKPEIEESLSIAANEDIQIDFTPHLLPMKRGIISTIYVKGDAEKVRESLDTFYSGEHFVNLAFSDIYPSTAHVAGSNHCVIGVYGTSEGKTTIISVIDNLTKGASGQALQNMNLIFGLEEKTGLVNSPLFP